MVNYLCVQFLSIYVKLLFFYWLPTTALTVTISRATLHWEMFWGELLTSWLLTEANDRIELARWQPWHYSPHSFVETKRAEAVTALSLQWSPQDFLARITQMFVFEVVGENFLWEARFVAFQGRWWRRLLCSHYSPYSIGVVSGVCSRQQTQLNEIELIASDNTLLFGLSL